MTNMSAFFLTEKDQPLSHKPLTIKEQKNSIIGEVLYSGINRRDLWIQRGLYPGIQFPTVLGSDGVIMYNDQKYIINPNIDWGNNPKVPGKSYNILGLEHYGTFATHVQVQRDRIHPMPSHLNLEQAGTIGLAGLTAYRALASNCQVHKTDRVFINGIGGAVALFAMQFALAIGAEVHVSSSSPEKIEKAMALGAKGGANYREENWGKNYKKANGGFDVIIDSAGGKDFNQLINLCNIGGRIGIYGGTRGSIESISPQHLFFKQIHIFGSTMGNDQEFSDMIQLIQEYKIEPIVDTIFPLDKINEAFTYALDKSRFGKVAIKNS